MIGAAPAFGVIAAGFHPTVQDLGRFGAQNLGVPVSGALDPIALRLANALVGNREGEAALELRLLGPTLEVLTDSVRITLVGTDAPIEVLGTVGRVVAPGRALRLFKGQRFRIGAIKDTACAYLAVEGGFDLPTPFGSKSTYVRSAIGGFQGRALQDGDRLPLSRPEASSDALLALPAMPDIYGSGPVRVILGPQADFFTDAAISTFLSAEYDITRDADRMGLRLEGPELAHARGYNIASDGIATGAVQVPGTCKPIVLLTDHQTTGGYPKIATVISADLPRVGRLRPGTRVSFHEVTVDEAETLRRNQETSVQEVLAGLHVVGETPNLNESALYHVNLISGTVRVGAL